MGYPTRIQAIKRGKKYQWYINFPSVLASVMNFKKSEVVEWELDAGNHLILKRLKKKKGQD